jgi:hypothetical protein
MPRYRNSPRLRIVFWPLYCVGVFAAAVAAGIATVGGFDIICKSTDSSASGQRTEYASASLMLAHEGAAVIDCSIRTMRSAPPCSGTATGEVVTALARNPGAANAATSAYRLLLFSMTLLLALTLSSCVGATCASEFHHIEAERHVDASRPTMVRWASVQAALTLVAAFISMCSVAAFRVGFLRPLLGPLDSINALSEGKFACFAGWHGEHIVWVSVGMNLLLGSVPLAILHSICIPPISNTALVAAAATAAAAADADADADASAAARRAPPSTRTMSPFAAAATAQQQLKQGAPSVSIGGLFTMRL